MDATAKIAELQAALDDMLTSIDLFFVLMMGIICFLLQAGFGLLEVGCVRAKNAQNIMLKNVMDAAVGAIAYYAFGYSVAYGTYIFASRLALTFWLFEDVLLGDGRSCCFLLLCIDNSTSCLTRQENLLH